MAFLIDQLNNSGLFAQSAYSAGIATCDSDGNIITATYLTGVDLTPYQTTADMINYQTVSGMTAYATTGDVANKLDTTAFGDVSGTFLTAHQSLDDYATTAWVDSQGYLTAHQPISADEWNNVYDTVNVYSGSWTGSESSPTASVDSNGSIDIVSSNNTVYFDVNGTWFNNAVNSALPTSAAQWNSNYDTVNTNSGVWGGSALNISAGEGVKVTLVNNNLVFSTDETVLWETTSNNATACSFSENWQNFEKIDVYAMTNDNIGFVTTFPNYSRIGQVTLRNAFYSTAYGVYDKLATFNMTTGGMTSLKQCVARFGPGSAQYSFTTGDGIWLKKVVGINRINNA